jgi:hypothetical protein
VVLSMQPVLATAHNVKTTVAQLSATIRCEPASSAMPILPSPTAPALAPKGRRTSLLSPRRASLLPQPALKAALPRESIVVAPGRMLAAGVGRMVSAASSRDSSADAAGESSMEGASAARDSLSSSCSSSFAAAMPDATPAQRQQVQSEAAAASADLRDGVGDRSAAPEAELALPGEAAGLSPAVGSIERAVSVASVAAEDSAAVTLGAREAVGAPPPGGPWRSKQGGIRRVSIRNLSNSASSGHPPLWGVRGEATRLSSSSAGGRSSSSSSSSSRRRSAVGLLSKQLPQQSSGRQQGKPQPRFRRPSADADLGAIISRLLSREASVGPASRRTSLMSRSRPWTMRSGRTLSADDSFISHDAREWERVQYREDQKRYGKLVQDARGSLPADAMANQYSDDDLSGFGVLGSREWSAGSGRSRNGSTGSACFAFETDRISHDGDFQLYSQWTAALDGMRGRVLSMDEAAASGDAVSSVPVPAVEGGVAAAEGGSHGLAMSGGTEHADDRSSGEADRQRAGAVPGTEHPSTGPCSPHELCPIADYFAVIGNRECCAFTATKSGFDAAVLQCWPSHSHAAAATGVSAGPPYELPTGLAQLCLPQARFGNLLQEDAPQPATFHFNIRSSSTTTPDIAGNNEAGRSTIFAACLVFFEQLCEVRCLDGEAVQRVFVPKCFCLLSRWPFARVLESYLLELYLSASACLAVKSCSESSPVPAASPLGAGSDNERCVQKQLCASLRAFMQLKVPVPFLAASALTGGARRTCDAMQLGIDLGSGRVLHLCSPPTMPVCDLTAAGKVGAQTAQQLLPAHLVDEGVGVHAHALLGQLSTARVLTVLAAALMGRQLIFVSSDVSVLTDAAETLRLLLSPLDMNDIVCIPYYAGPIEGSVDSPWSLLPPGTPCLIGVVAEWTEEREDCVAEGMIPQSEHRRLRRWSQRMRKVSRALAQIPGNAAKFNLGKGGCELDTTFADEEDHDDDLSIFRAMHALDYAPPGGYAVLLDHDQLVSGDLSQLLCSSAQVTSRTVQSKLSQMATNLSLPSDRAIRLEASLTRTKRRYCSSLAPMDQLPDVLADTASHARGAQYSRGGVSFHERGADGGVDVQRSAVDRETAGEQQTGLHHDTLFLAESCMVVKYFLSELFGRYRRYFVYDEIGDEGFGGGPEASVEFDQVAFAADGMCVNPRSMNEVRFASAFVHSEMFSGFLERAHATRRQCMLRDRADRLAVIVTSLHDHASSCPHTSVVQLNRKIMPPLPSPIAACGLGSFAELEKEQAGTGWPIVPLEDLLIDSAIDDEDTGDCALGAAAASSAGGVLKHRDQQEFFLEELWESERFFPVSGWGAARLPGDPGRWSMLARAANETSRRACSVTFNNRDEAFQDITLPSSLWTWADAWHVDTEVGGAGSRVSESKDASVSTDFRDDGDGWLYGSFFSMLDRPRLLSSTHRASEQKLDVVRRRRWVRTRCRGMVRPKGPRQRIVGKQFVQSVAQSQGKRVASMSCNGAGEDVLSFDAADSVLVSAASSSFAADSTPLVICDSVRLAARDVCDIVIQNLSRFSPSLLLCLLCVART